GYTPTKKGSEIDLFRKDLRSHTASVRGAFERLFYGAQKEMASEAAEGIGDIWNDLDQEELILEDLKRLRFPDPQRAYENLLAVR
ncbi:MAG: hypothetical protein GTO64_09290, partial [Candidatus Latescibacteria bacterium]|nr:hypothetical protein [Candidatus Latescibacterota bacterium]NIT03089.1 hypothetical protein [Candidatus Latescibacterota bacterium]NIT39506.1 hypothetical protein [Candidatus Latescibacterota bacterium]